MTSRLTRSSQPRRTPAPAPLALALARGAVAVIAAATVVAAALSRPEPTAATLTVPFQGCDGDGRCAEFRLVALGASYRWAAGADVAPDADVGALTPLIAEEMRAASAVVALGQAAYDRDEDARLGACRAKRAAAWLEDAQAVLDTRTRIYRLNLGPRAAGDWFGEGPHAGVERQAALVFVRGRLRGLDLPSALRQGFAFSLPAALRGRGGPFLSRQMDFERYGCFAEDAFALSRGAAPAERCFAEPSENPVAFCADFTARAAGF